MAHHQKNRMDGSRKPSAVQSLLKIFNLSNAPSVIEGDDEAAAEADEPPDDQVPEISSVTSKDPKYARNPAPPRYLRRESLLTKAIIADSSPTSPDAPHTTRGLSTTSSHSAASMGSTAELTSDDCLTSPTRSATPSPPLPSNLRHCPHVSRKSDAHQNVLIAPITKDDKPVVAEVGEAAVEKTLGRKRCIMFACGGRKDIKPVEVPAQPITPKEPEKRKCMLTFACPTKQTTEASKRLPETKKARLLSPAPPARRSPPAATPVKSTSDEAKNASKEEITNDHTPKLVRSPPTFHEFAESQDETDAWVNKPQNHKEKLTLDDCMKKEMAIRKLGREADEEAEAEEQEQEDLDADVDEEDNNEDDFAPSDGESDGGNESDDEGGFADSDEESDAGSDYQFWAPRAPSTTTAATSTDNLTLSHFSSRHKSRVSSVDSRHSTSTPPPYSQKFSIKRRSGKPIMRPGTPELPDSTDFVCGTLDEDRPLEAAYISCREQKKLEKHIPIPQDIDPSFPTTDPEDDDEIDEEEGDLEELEDLESDSRGRGKVVTPLLPPSPAHAHLAAQDRPQLSRQTTNRSPPPKQLGGRSPPPRRLFNRSPTRFRSPAPTARLRSPRGSPTNVNFPIGFNINRLAQRPNAEMTSSLPHTPNPFFRNFKLGSQSISNVASRATSPGAEEDPRRTDMHVRGPIDIVMGLERKRQKRKEKFWRQHCRKYAKEQAERKHVAAGRGAERMKELGLVCAERTRGYTVTQPTPLVISL